MIYTVINVNKNNEFKIKTKQNKTIPQPKLTLCKIKLDTESKDLSYGTYEYSLFGFLLLVDCKLPRFIILKLLSRTMK